MDALEMAICIFCLIGIMAILPFNIWLLIVNLYYLREEI